MNDSGSARSTELDQALQLWHQYEPVVNPVVQFGGQPYVESDDAGSSFSKEGRQYYADVKRGQLFATDNQKGLQAQLACSGLPSCRRPHPDGAARLRELLSAGVLAALVLAAAAAYFQITRSRHERAAQEAQEQTRDILKTVREGFFLLDAEYKIGTVWSEALTRMFSRNDFAGLSFEDLLKKNLVPVPSTTLSTAMKYIKLLWGDRAHENLMKSINPLGQLEISMDNGHGGKETRYLQFDFHRVMGPKGIKHVLCAVGDITSSVLLAKELQESQENANAQLDMMLGMMHVDPLQLTSFLDSTETGLQLINAILKEPARTDGEFRKKLNGLFRELHSIKGESSALNLMSICQPRMHLPRGHEVTGRPEEEGRAVRKRLPAHGSQARRAAGPLARCARDGRSPHDAQGHACPRRRLKRASTGGCSCSPTPKPRVACMASRVRTCRQRCTRSPNAWRRTITRSSSCR